MKNKILKWSLPAASLGLVALIVFQNWKYFPNLIPPWDDSKCWLANYDRSLEPIRKRICNEKHISYAGDQDKGLRNVISYSLYPVILKEGPSAEHRFLLVSQGARPLETILKDINVNVELLEESGSLKLFSMKRERE
jgi:hypothetical protein